MLSLKYPMLCKCMRLYRLCIFRLLQGCMFQLGKSKQLACLNLGTDSLLYTECKMRLKHPQY